MLAPFGYREGSGYYVDLKIRKALLSELGITRRLFLSIKSNLVSEFNLTCLVLNVAIF
jgi:hypothetical protein